MTRRRVGALLLILSVGVLVAMATVALVSGRPTVSVGDLPALLTTDTGGQKTEQVRLVLVELRLPRVVLAVVAGAALGLSGALLQDGLRNPLASPELLGVSSGSAVVVAAVSVLALPVPRAAVPVAALAGGLAVGALCLIAGVRLRSTSAQLLCGLACASFLSGVVVALVTLGEPGSSGLLYQYLLGSLANRGWSDVALVAAWSLPVVPVGLVMARGLNTLRLGDDTAVALGLPVPRFRVALLVLASLLTAAVVAVCGPIGFVALLVPHLVRRALRTSDAVWVLPFSAVAGAVLLTVADTLTRAVVEPREVAAGIVTVLVGAPVLLLLLTRRDARAAVG